MENKIDILSLEEYDLKNVLTEMGEKSFRGNQIFINLHKNLNSDFNCMTNLSLSLRETLTNNFDLKPLKLIKTLKSEKDTVIKFLFELHDGSYIESVYMEYNYGNSVCISSQAGCKMKCSFCASAYAPFDRNLTAGEMLSQIYEIQKYVEKRVSHVVVMGIGEPFDNYDELIKFIKILNHKDGLNISQRNITVSTCGLAEKIYEFADFNSQVNLAVSLHAPNDEIRSKTMPVNNAYSIDELLVACKYYTEKTKRRITFEYALIKGFNDEKHHAKELKARLKGFLCHVNLLTPNNIKASNFEKVDSNRIEEFMNVLKEGRIEATLRRKMGADIDAACGQLRINNDSDIQ